MIRLENEVKKNLIYIAVWTGALSIVLEAAFLIAGFWDIFVLVGNLVGSFAAVFNFYLLCVTVQKALEMDKEKAMKKVRLSKSLRMLVMAAICALGIWLLKANPWATVIPLLFPRVALTVYSVRHKKDKDPVSLSGGSDNPEL